MRLIYIHFIAFSGLRIGLTNGRIARAVKENNPIRKPIHSGSIDKLFKY